MARKTATKMSRAVSQLEHMFNKMNEDFFNNECVTPIITVQSSPRSYGHCSTAKVWKKKDDNTYELNVSAEMLSCPIEELLDTLAHEMIHLYHLEKGIQDVSSSRGYHNEKFHQMAVKIGLDCFKTDSHGWNTRGGEKMLEYAISNDWLEIELGRETSRRISFGDSSQATLTVASSSRGVKAPSSTRKYKCPICGQTIRATKDVNIICGDCMVKMEKC